jgi:hypothetical protein
MRLAHRWVGAQAPIVRAGPHSMSSGDAVVAASVHPATVSLRWLRHSTRSREDSRCSPRYSNQFHETADRGFKAPLEFGVGEAASRRRVAHLRPRDRS